MPELYANLRRGLKNLLAWSLYRSGWLAWRLRRELRGQCVVLMYHRVMPDTARQQTFSHDAIIVDPQRFAMHLDTLARHFEVVTLSDYAASLDAGVVAERPRLLITFDDAWADNYHTAYPRLRERGLPATIFVPVDYIGSGKLFWQEELGHLLRAACEIDSAQTLLSRYGWQDLPALAEPARSTCIKQAVRDIKHLDYAALETVLNQFRALTGRVDHGPDAYLSLEQMREMAAHDIRFESHACSHRMLPRLSDGEIATELQRSFDWLREKLGTAPLAIAYPNGDFDKRVLERTQAAGYRLGFSTRAGAIDTQESRYALRRVNIHDDSAASPARFLMSVYLACRHGRRH